MNYSREGSGSSGGLLEHVLEHKAASQQAVADKTPISIQVRVPPHAQHITSLLFFSPGIAGLGKAALPPYAAC